MDKSRLECKKLLAVLLTVGVVGCGDKEIAESEQLSNIGSGEVVKKTTLKVASVFPTSLELLGTNLPVFVKQVERVTGGSLILKAFEPNALVPPLESIPAVSKGSVDAAWSTPGFWSGTDSAFNFFTTVPFGPRPGEFLAWIYRGGGLDLLNGMFVKYDLHAIPCGIQPPEASGWFRREISSVEDLKGLKMRFFGLGAKVMDNLGVATQLLAPGEIFQALQLGTIDATEFANPSVDKGMGFSQIAKYYYFPGWHQPTSILYVIINTNKWDEMPDQHKAAMEFVCGNMITQMLAEAEATQWTAMKEMQEKDNVVIKRWSPEIIGEFKSSWQKVVEEESAKNENFKQVYDSYRAFREKYSLWGDYGYLP